eukprot:347417-Chlamydomonas_euryale.AAC.5
MYVNARAFVYLRTAGKARALQGAPAKGGDDHDDDAPQQEALTAHFPGALAGDAPPGYQVTKMLPGYQVTKMLPGWGDWIQRDCSYTPSIPSKRPWSVDRARVRGASALRPGLQRLRHALEGLRRAVLCARMAHWRACATAAAAKPQLAPLSVHSCHAAAAGYAPNRRACAQIPGMHLGARHASNRRACEDHLQRFAGSGA